MDPDLRRAILASGVIFCAILAYLTIATAARHGVSVLTVVSLLVIGLIATGLAGAMLEPPDEDG